MIEKPRAAPTARIANDATSAMDAFCQEASSQPQRKGCTMRSLKGQR